MRIVLALAILALLSVASSERARDRMGETLGAGRAAVPPGAAGDLPPEYRRLMSSLESASASGRLREGAGGLPGVLEAAGPRPFADLGAPREVARVKRDIHAGLRRVSARMRPRQRVRVGAFHGVFVAGTRALAVLDYARSVRDGGGRGGWRRLPLERREVTLRREGGRWRFAGWPASCASAPSRPGSRGRRARACG